MLAKNKYSKAVFTQFLFFKKRLKINKNKISPMIQFRLGFKLPTKYEPKKAGMIKKIDEKLNCPGLLLAIMTIT